MADPRLIETQRIVLSNQRTILKNQRKLDRLLSTQAVLERILKNQLAILKNQREILSVIRKTQARKSPKSAE